MIALLAGIALQAVAAVNAPVELSRTLRARDQRLLDAIAPGDRKVWEEALTQDAVYVDENGEVMTRADFLNSLQPLPAKVSGSLKIVSYQLRLNGDTALVIHKDDEHENYHGHPLEANYLMTETWVRRNDDWKLAMVHAYVVATDPPAIAVSPAKLDEYAGRYSAGPDLDWTIRRAGDHLMAGREGARPQPLLVESADVMFVRGQPRERRIFQRDAAGRVRGFIERREGEDIPWTKVP